MDCAPRSSVAPRSTAVRLAPVLSTGSTSRRSPWAYTSRSVSALLRTRLRAVGGRRLQQIRPLRCPHVDDLSRLLEDARAVRRARRDPIGVARRQDALLAGDDHREAPFHDDAELLHLVLVRFDDRL